MEAFIADGKEPIESTGSVGQIYSKGQWKKPGLFTEIGGHVTTAGIGEFDFLTGKQPWSVSGDGTTLARELENPKQTVVYYKQ